MKRRYFGFLGLTVATLVAFSSAHAADLCPQVFLPPLQRAKLEIGLFARVGQKRQTEIGEIYLADMAKGGGSTAKPPSGEVRRVDSGDLSLNLDTMSPQQLARLRGEGLQSIKGLYVVTSGAGLWSRGAGQVKAVVPFNLGVLLGSEEIARLEHLSVVATVSKPEDAFAKAGLPLPPAGEIAAKADALVTEAKAEIEALLSKARNDQRALTPLDLKFVNVALSSARAKTYIPFDVWTSEQTHEVIINYIKGLKSNYMAKSFHADPSVDHKIKSALKRYFEMSDVRGETHVLGIQIGVKALDPKTGQPVESSVAIGEGAGMLKHYLDGSGRTKELAAEGKHTLLFDNIEVVSDLELDSAAHQRAGKEVSVILVPQKDGYSGGSPFLVKKEDGTWNIELHEQSALPAELASGNSYFNSNTLLYSLNLKPPYELGYESKTDRGQKIVRVKMNAGDVTKAASTAGIGGRIGTDYENFKNYKEFNTLGARLIETYQGIWKSLAGG